MIAVAVAVEFLFFGLMPVAAIRSLGLRRAAAPSMLATLGLCVLLLGFFPLYAFLAGAPLRMRADWYWLLPGLFAQGGVAEETLFRGYLFRRQAQGPGILAGHRPSR